jgi:hypothetical protein
LPRAALLVHAGHPLVLLGKILTRRFTASVTGKGSRVPVTRALDDEARPSLLRVIVGVGGHPPAGFPIGHDDHGARVGGAYAAVDGHGVSRAGRPARTM